MWIHVSNLMILQNINRILPKISGSQSSKIFQWHKYYLIHFSRGSILQRKNSLTFFLSVEEVVPCWGMRYNNWGSLFMFENACGGDRVGPTSTKTQNTRNALNGYRKIVSVLQSKYFKEQIVGMKIKIL